MVSKKTTSITQERKIMAFLPANYEAPKTSNSYMKLQDGENRIRILSAPVLGWEEWFDKKPIRCVYDESKPNKGMPKPMDANTIPKHFWAFVVFNYALEEVQILQIHQASIRGPIQSLSEDEDWGSPFTYDLKIYRTGEGVNTEYSVNPVPHKPLDPYIIGQFKKKPCNLSALFLNEDPFSEHWDEYTPLGIECFEEKVVNA